MKTYLIPAILAVTLAWQTAAAQPSTSIMATPPLEKVVATVDGKEVTYGDLLKVLEMSPPAVQQNPMLALQNLYMMKYLAGEAEKLKLGDQSPWKEALEAQRMNTLANAMINVHRETSGVQPGSIETYYNANQSKFPQAKVKLIYVAFKAGVTQSATNPADLARAAQEALLQAHATTNRSEAEAKTLADEIVKMARNGSDFAALVKQYSDDPESKANQGDVPVIKHDSTVYADDFKKAVFALDSGKISDPIRQASGFYIVRMEEKSTQPLSEVNIEILQILRQTTLDEWFRDLNQRFRPEIKDPTAFVKAGSQGLGVQPVPHQ